MKYRPEIDGLRTIALLPVVFFHAGITQFSGGYVGVDVFFVISGFLITGIILRELQSGEFSVIRFYERRARRILPALFAMIAVSSVLAGLILLPYEFVTYARGVIAALLFASNILFWRESGYFAASSEENPLLHTWSLAVEEQFYILFPLVLLFIWRWFPRGLIPLLVITFIVSLAIADFFSTRSVSANFYLLPTRAWELLAGSLTAVFVMRRGTISGMVGQAFGIAGLAAIIFAILYFDSATPFPSLWAIVPVFGSVAIILGATPATAVGSLLSSKPLVGIGIISYSTYLWHQPLFAFARILHAETQPSIGLMLGLAFTSLGLGWLSWRFVERPFRRPGAFSRNKIFALSGLGMAVFTGLGLLTILSQGHPQRYPVDQRAWILKGPVEYAKYVTSRYNELRNAPLSLEQPNLLIVGDSFSQDFYNMVLENGAFVDHAVSTIDIPTRCQIYFGVSYNEIEANINRGDRRLCQTRFLTNQHVEKMRSSDVVIFAPAWRLWAAESFRTSLDAMALPPEVSVFVVGSKKFIPRRSLLSLDANKSIEVRSPVSDELQLTTEVLARTLDPNQFINIQKLLCEGGCRLLTDAGAIISYDGGHLTREGAKFIGKILFETSPLKEFAS